jgi:hypothetical protein
MSTKIVFYIVKGFGLINRGMRVKRKCKQDFASKAAEIQTCARSYATLG